MSAKQSTASVSGDTVLSEENQSVYSALFAKINLNPVVTLGGIEAFQTNEALSEASADERVPRYLLWLIRWVMFPTSWLSITSMQRRSLSQACPTS